MPPGATPSGGYEVASGGAEAAPVFGSPAAGAPPAGQVGATPPGVAQPPGFGHSPAVPMGAPPGPGPARERSPLPMFIGLGLGALVLVVAIIWAIVVLVSSGGEVASETGTTTEATETAETAPPVEPTGEGKVELRDVRIFPARGTRKTYYVVGELWNTGTAPVDAPRAKVTVFDAGGKKLDDTLCAAFVVHDLMPNQKVPCYSVLDKASGWKRFEIEPESSRRDVRYRTAELKISKLESTSPRSRFGAHKVSGTITNRSAFTAKSVWVIVGLYDAKGKIVGAGKTLVSGNDLAPGASGKFNVSIYNVAPTPKTSLTKVFGYDK